MENFTTENLGSSQTTDNSRGLIVCLYSDANFLAVSILENLLAQKCFVNIVTKDVKKWKEKTINIATKNRFSITEKGDTSSQQKYSYIIFCGGFISSDRVYEDLEVMVNDSASAETKTLALLPFEYFNQKNNSKIDINDNLAVVYLGDLFGPRMDLDSELLSSRVINEILQERSLTLGVGEVFYPIFITDAVKTVSKWLFSFGPYGKELFLLGPQTSGTTFWQENQKLVSEINLKYSNEIETRFVPRGYETKNIPCNLKGVLTETYRWLSNNSNTITPESKPKKLPKVIKKKTKRVYPKYLKPLVTSLVLVLIFPLIALLISSGFFFISYKYVISGKEEKTQGSILVAKTFAVLAKQESNLLSYIPIVGRIYKETAF